MKVIEIDYTIENNDMIWKVGILANDKEEAVRFLKKNVRLKHIHTISQTDSNIHCFTDEIIEKILIQRNTALNKKGKKK